MRVKILCPNAGCGASYNVEDRRLGREARCRHCGRRFPLVPETRPDGSTTLPFVDEALPTGRTGPDGLPPRFGRYRVVRRIGRGGMGTVYLAEDTELERQVALKIPHIAPCGGPEVRERFLREARAAARFRHPNFCPIHDIGEVDGIPYLTMAFLEGRTLASMIDHGEPWPQRKAAEFARQLALALAEAHRQGVVHRDLKPANVMVEDRGGLVLMDFGLARRLDSGEPAFTANGVILGTPAYMPPEQAEGDRDAVGPCSDIYSLGVVLYELLTGRRPFEGSTARILGQVARDDPPRPSAHNPEIDPRLESICLKAMDRRPEDRYPSMDELAGTLDGWLGSEDPSTGVRDVETDVEGPPLAPGPDSPATVLEPSRPGRHPRGFRLSIHAWGFRVTLAVVGSVMLLVAGYRFLVQRQDARNSRLMTSSSPISASRRIDEVLARTPPGEVASRIGMTLVTIPSGVITRKARPGLEEREGRDWVTVQVQPFQISVHEVFRYQYLAVTGRDPSSFRGGRDHPVESVSWGDAVGFCNRLSSLQGLEPFYQLDGETATARDPRVNGYRLPTEDEWEYACNGGPGTVGFPGYPDTVDRFAWYVINSERTTHPVGRLKHNGFGLFDLRGNVEEWCFDASDDPGGPSPTRVVRGGSWASEQEQVESPARSTHPPGHKDRTIGFRVARDAR